MYQIIVKTFWGDVVEVFENFFDLSMKLTIDTDGDFSFSLDWKDEKVSPQSVQMFNLCVVRRVMKNGKWKTICTGYMDNISYKENNLNIKCCEMLKFFRNRFSSSSMSFVGKKAWEVASDVLNYTNGIGDTGIRIGKKENDFLVDFSLNRQRLLDVFKNIAGSAACDIWVDSEMKMNVGRRGVDRFDIPPITYDYYLSDANTVSGIDAGYESIDFATRLIGKSGNIESIKTMPRPGMPVVEKLESFSGISSVGTLDMRTLQHLQEVAKTLPNISVSPSSPERMMEEVEIGDFVNVYCKFKGVLFTAQMRIVEMQIKIGDNADEGVKLSLSETKNFRKTLLDVISKMEKRINEI